MKKRFNEIFPPDITNAYHAFKSLRSSKDEWKYLFMDDSEFSKLSDLGQASKIYWTEMLYRAHIIVHVSIFKTLRWLEAVDNNLENFYGFCSSLRGLIESVSDTFYTLKKFPLTIATDFKVIRQQIAGNSIILTTHKILEDELLHFIQATKIPKDQIPGDKNVYIAKHLSEYIKSIDDNESSLKNLYGYLCGVAHPAFESNQIFLFLYKGETIVCNDSENFEISMIDSIVESNYETIQNMFRAYYNNLISVLLLLNEFEIERLNTEISAEQEFKTSDPWKRIEHEMQNSIRKYTEAKETGNYN